MANTISMQILYAPSLLFPCIPPPHLPISSKPTPYLPRPTLPPSTQCTVACCMALCPLVWIGSGSGKKAQPCPAPPALVGDTLPDAPGSQFHR